MFSKIKRQVNLKFRFLDNHFKENAFKLLDIGAGNHSASRTMKLFPKCEYYGLDVTDSFNNDANDFESMKEFYLLDLTLLDLSSIPDNYFDVIIMAHVIEHLHNGDEVLPLILKKLKPKGLLYLEYPGEKSTKLPSMKGTLNFYDDPTHVRIYSIQELKKIIDNNDSTVLRSGIRRNYYYIILTPFRIIISFIKRKGLEGCLFWDILGFAEYLHIEKSE